jgi:uncharacterized repeat protein (TIGR01451 family)
VDLSYRRAEKILVGFSSAGLTQVISDTIDVRPAATAEQMVFVGELATSVAGDTISNPFPAIQLRDAYGNDVTIDNVIVTIALDGTGILTGTDSMRTDANGRATFDDLSINLAGRKRLTASSGVLPMVMSNTFTLTTVANLSLAMEIEKTLRDTIWYSITVQNQGPSGFKDPIQVHDSLPPSLIYLPLPSDGWTASDSGQMITWTRDTTVFLIDNSSVITFAARVSPTGLQEICNAACVNTSFDPQDSNNCDTITVSLQKIRPGDTDSNNVVNAADIIQIALCYAAVVPARFGIHDSLEQYLPFLDGPMQSCLRADCNGDGRIDTGDVNVIVDNWGRTNWDGSPSSNGNRPSRRKVIAELMQTVLAMSPGSVRDELLAMLRSAAEPLPTSWTLQQNFPNPFNAETIIRYGVPEKSANVRIVLYNILGQQIKVFEQQDVGEGWHEFRWNGTGDYQNAVGSGVYYYRLEAPFLSAVKKIVYLR